MTIRAFNKITFRWTAVEDINDLPNIENWVLNPIFTDIARANQIGPRFWIFESDGQTIRPMTDEEIDTKPEYLEQTKTKRIAELSEECELAISSGYISNALGQDYIYDSEIVDQLNLTSAITTTMPTAEYPDGVSIYYACRNVATGKKTYELHTHSQLRHVLSGGAQMKLFNLQKFNTKRDIINDATKVSQVLAITWDSVE